jgi:protein-disulfide isomerase
MVARLRTDMVDGVWPSGSGRQTMSRGAFRWRRRRLLSAGLVVLLLSLTLGAPGARGETAVAAPLAEVNGETITVKELEQAAGVRLARLEEQLYELKRRELEALIADRLFAQEAARRSISVSALLDAEVTSKVTLVTEQEIDLFYQANKARVRGDEASGRQQIRTHLQQQKLFARRDEFVSALRSKSKIVMRLPSPSVVRVAVGTQGAPVRGPAEAPVTLVEFSDFHCPFCKQSQATLKRLLERYPAKLRLVYRDLPLDQLHPQARRAAEAARCATDQGKFWEYHDILFAEPPQANGESLRRYAERAGLDTVVFERCLASGSHREAVQRDVEEGTRLGITGTPAFFVNGRPLLGAQPLEAFTRLIDEELAQR